MPGARRAQTRRPGAVLFVCGLNTIRSPMAAAIARKLYGRSMHVASAGVRRGEPDPFVTVAMAEVGVDLSGHHPHQLEDIADDYFDLIVTLSPEAHHRALELTRTLAVDVEYWPTYDPTAATGSREQILSAYREVRDLLERRIRERFGEADHESG